MQMQKIRKMIRTCSIVLICLTILTTCMVGRLLAKYTTTDSGADDGRTAAFYMNIEAIDPLPGGLFWNPVDGDGNKNEFRFKVVGSSEVEMSYTLEVKLTPADGNAYEGDWSKISPKISLISENSIEEPYRVGAPIIADDNISRIFHINDLFLMKTEQSCEAIYTLKLVDDTTDGNVAPGRFYVEILIDAVQVD